MIIKGKTGWRRARLIAADPYLRRWLNDHPRREDAESPLWIKSDGTQLGWAALSAVIKRAAEKAGLRKRIHAHLFRHSRATFLAKHLTESQLCELLGWRQGSDMAATYIHLSGRDLDGALLGLYGIKLPEKEQSSQLKPKQCPRCSELNPLNAKFCLRCGIPLDPKLAMEFEGAREQLHRLLVAALESDGELKQRLIQRLMEVAGRESLRI